MQAHRNSMFDCAIFDVDGTLCDVSGIRHYLNNGNRNFNAFHSESVNCPPHQWVVEMAQETRNNDIAIIVVTARKSRWFNHTWWWLNENRVPYDELLMRDDWDQRPDYEVKNDILTRIRARWNPLFAVDDNPNVIELWQQNGIPAIVVPGWEDD